MKYKGTERKPVEIKGEGTPANIPNEPIPPAVKEVPQSLELTPRENTDLHAELAAHYGITDLDSTPYEELENNLRKDINAKTNNGIALDPKEQTLLNKVLKADTADRALREAANKEQPKLPDDIQKKMLEDAKKKADGEKPAVLNEKLVKKGMGDDSLLVSHPPAPDMKATAEPMNIPGLPEGITTEDALRHEFAHIAIGVIDGLEPVEIRSDIHPKSDKGAGATAVFNGASIRDAAGNVDEEALANQETQWLTQKMAGPASHEVFKGMTREDIQNSPATRSDFRSARAIVREVHPDFTATQVNAVVDAAYDRARSFLTQAHIADRIRANAAVREQGLSQTLHASHGRLSQFAEDIRNAHNEHTGNDAGPDGGGAGEGGEKAENPAAEGEEKNAGRDKGGKPEGAPKPASESSKTRGVAESEVKKIDQGEVLEGIKRQYGVHDDPKMANMSSFITPDGRYIDLPSGVDHTDAIEDSGGGKADHKTDNRPAFINESKTVRAHQAKERAGNVLAYSVPKEGMSPQQVEAMERSVGANADRNGVLRIERADVNPENKNEASADKDFPRVSDVKPMLRKIGAIEESKIDSSRQIPQLIAHETNGGSTFSPEGENLSGKDLYAVGSYPDRARTVDQLTPQILKKFKDNNADLLSQGDHAVGTWKDPDTGKVALDISKLHTDRDQAIKAGQDANQKAIYHLGTGETIPTGGTGEALTPEESQIGKSPKGSSVPLMQRPLAVEGTGEKGKVSTLDVAQALNEYSQKKNPALVQGEAEPKEMVDRAKKIAEDEAKYQLAQGRTGKEWYTTEMKDHDKVLQEMRPELTQGPDVDAVPGHPAKLTLFKAAEAVLSSGQKPFGNIKAAVKAWDAYNETGEFPRLNPATGKSWGPRGEAAYGNGLDMINKLVAEKGEKGAADWLLADHPVSELKNYNDNIKGSKKDERPGALILGEKRGPFMQNLHGIESAFTADMWVSRSWNRWMGTMEFGKDPKTGETGITSDAPRNGAERDLMKQSFEHTADKLGLSTSSLQAVLWYYEQALYRAHGVPKDSWSFSDAAKRVASEQPGAEEQSSFNFGQNASPKEDGGFSALAGKPRKGATSAADLLQALK
jgi:hypothetical protein